MNNMSPRERMLALIVLSVVGLGIIYQFGIDRYLKSRAELDTQIAERKGDVAKGEATLDRARNLRKTENELQARGLKSDVAAARSQLLYNLSGWAKEAGVGLSSMKEGRTTPEGKWLQINTQATATGSQKAIANLLWRVESSTLPVRISDMTINSRREGTDDLQISLGVSTLCPNPEKSDSPVRRPVASAAGGREP